MNKDLHKELLNQKKVSKQTLQMQQMCKQKIQDRKTYQNRSSKNNIDMRKMHLSIFVRRNLWHLLGTIQCKFNPSDLN